MPPRATQGRIIELAELVEKDWAAQIAQLAAQTGFSRYHTYRSKRSPVGFPDEVLVRERILFAELKREKTKPTPDQVDWLDRLARAGGECYLWRPSDLDEIALVLGKRWKFITDEGEPYLADGTRSEVLQPGSMWIPGAGRRDGR